MSINPNEPNGHEPVEPVDQPVEPSMSEPVAEAATDAAEALAPTGTEPAEPSLSESLATDTAAHEASQTASDTYSQSAAGYNSPDTQLPDFTAQQAAGYAMPAATTVEPSIEQPWYGIDFVNAIKRGFKKYFVFEGRASRGEFWWFYLVAMIASLVLVWIPLLGWIASIAIALPMISLGWRRMHDVGKPGWWYIALGAAAGVVGSLGSTLSFALGGYDEFTGLPKPNGIVLAIFSLAALALTIWNIYLLAQPANAEGNKYDLAPGAPISGTIGVPKTAAAPGFAAGTAGAPAASTFGATPFDSAAPAAAAEADPVLAEIANPATPAARLQEIASLVPTHPEYKEALLAHPNMYPALRTWLSQL